MIVDREITINIYNEAGTSIEYSNSTDDFEVVSNSMRINKGICDTELSFGNVISSMAEFQIYNLGTNLIASALERRKIQIIMTETEQLPLFWEPSPNYTSRTYMGDDEDNYLIFDNLVDQQFAVHTYYLFTGYIDSYKTDYEETYYGIIAYDWWYYHKNDNMYPWWENYFSSSSATEGVLISVIASDLINSLRDPSSMNPDTNPTFINDFYVPKTALDDIKSTDIDDKPTISLEELVRALYEIQGLFIYIDGRGRFTFKRSTTSDSRIEIDTNSFEHDTSVWDNNNVARVDGVRVYDSIENTIIGEYTNGANNYDIVDNIFLHCLYKYNGGKTAVNNKCQTMYTNIFHTHIFYYNSYKGFDLHLVVSDFTYELGHIIRTPKGDLVVMEIEYSGELLINEQIQCHTQGVNLTPKITV